MKQVYYNNEEFKEILSILDDLINQAEKLPYPQARDLTTSILQHLDLVHREAVSRMCQYLQTHAPSHYLKLQGDYTINVLLKLYDVIEDKEEAQQPMIAGFVPESEVGLLTPIIKWERLGRLEEVEAGKLYKENIRGNPVVYSRINDEIFALRNECLDSTLPLDTGKLQEHYIICPWHGCRYDLKSGGLLDKPKVKQATFETRIQGSGIIEIKVPLNDI